MILKKFARSTNVVNRINKEYENLRNAEKTVADYILKNINHRLEFSITEMANEIGVSEATISRLSKSLGYRGFQDLKLSIAAGVGNESNIPNLPSKIHEKDSPEEVSLKLADALASSIRETRNILDHDALQKATAALGKAHQILFIGVGGAAAVCAEATHLFNKAGRFATCIEDGYSQIVNASTLNETHTVVGISHTGQTQSVSHALKLAREGGAATIAITSDRRSTVAETAEITLVTWKQQQANIPLFGDFLEGRSSQLYLVDLLFLSVLFQSSNGEKDNLHRTGAALQNYYF